MFIIEPSPHVNSFAEMIEVHMTSAFAQSQFKKTAIDADTVDTVDPGSPIIYKVYTSQVVQDFFHQH